MQQQQRCFTVGVEEEYQIIDPETRSLRQRAEAILSRAESAPVNVEAELQQSQIEIGTPVCDDLAQVRAELVRSRRAVSTAAAQEGMWIGAAGSHPLADPAHGAITPKERYLGMAKDYGQLAREQIVFGYHVHVGIDDREAAVQTMNRMRGWLSPMLALGGSSPFWMGRDTGYSSYRTDVWGRWPMAGSPEVFKSRAEYEDVIKLLVTTESIAEETRIYWDVRPSARFDTLEFRATDACMTVDEAVMIAGLARALTRRCYEQAVRDEAIPVVRPELLRAAKWRAARYGLDATLIDLHKHRSRPAFEVIHGWLTFLRPSLEDNGDWEEISALVQQTIDRGTGSARQRNAFGRGRRLEDVVDLVVAETGAG
ncbi:MAG: carboxylate-amine ligase [Actinomycetota bacterium]|nr:carboxylate-amine ligase [Actinomycetota bacterium]